MNSQIKPFAHQPKPVTLERDVNDVVIIEGVRYSGDYFRTMSAPNEDVLYAIHKGEDDVVRVTMIRDANEAENFFDRVFVAKEMETPLSPSTATSPQMENHNLGGEGKGENDVV